VVVEHGKQPAYTWAAGTYTDLFSASSLMITPNILCLYWIMFIDDTLVDAFGIFRILFVFGLMAVLGWLMAAILGIGFDTLPLIHRTSSFDETHLRMVTGLNIGGQTTILVGVLMGDVELFRQLGGIGVTMLSIQLILLGPSALKFFSERGRIDEKNRIIWTYIPALSLPTLGVLSLISWVLWDSYEIIQITWVILVDTFLVMICFSLILGHFNRRLDWELLEMEQRNKSMQIFLFLMFISIIARILFYSDEINDYRLQCTMALPIAYILLKMKPWYIFNNVISVKPYSKFILCGLFWLFISIPIILAESFNEVGDSGMIFSRFIILFGCAWPIVIGFGEWLHDDHKRKPIDERHTGWIALLSLNAALIFWVLGYLEELGYLTSSINLDTTYFWVLILLLVSVISTNVWWLKEMFWGLYDWNRIPLYYGHVHEIGDAYELGGEE
jgi:hypothetical protein